jgi:predicted ribosome quality control (RQC) complex YloA/Tae2 family protein
MNSLEILFWIKNIKKDLVSSKIQKVKQVSSNIFCFELYKQKINQLVLTTEKLFISGKSCEAGLLTNLGQILRKNLTGQVIQDVRQYEFDRIIEIETRDYILVLELFGNGNLVLLNKDRTIIIALEMRSWKDRKIKPKVEYKYPPSRINPFKLNQNELKELLKDKEVVKILATDLGFGGEVAGKICEKLGIDKTSKEIDASKLFSFIKNIDKEFEDLNNINESLKREFEEGHEIKKEVSGIKEKLERIVKKQEETLEKWKGKEEEYRKIGKLLYENYEEAKKKLDSNLKKIDIQGLNVELDLKKSVQKNAEIYFEKAKKAKKKVEGLLKAMKEIKKKELSESKKIKIENKAAKEWYDKFRWVISSDGFLLVAGKDAQTNEKLIRKHMKPTDLVFHTDITGSPFVLIKNPEGREIPEQTIKETAEFCGSYSKAWKVGIFAIDVYYIKPDQVKKEGGLPTGSFMIYGKREWIRQIPVKVAVGVKDNEVIFGPENMVKNKVKEYAIVIPDDSSSNEVAKTIQKKLKTKIELERLARIIPYGKGKVIE